MEAKLSVVADAARQKTINQAQQTLSTKQAALTTVQRSLTDHNKKIELLTSLKNGLTKIRAKQELDTGTNDSNKALVGWAMTSVISGDAATREEYFGKEIADKGVDAIWGMLRDLVPAYNTLDLSTGYTGGTIASESSGYTNFQIGQIIGVVSTRLTSVTNDSSFQTAVTSAQAEVTTAKSNLATLQSGGGTVSADANALTAGQWLAKELGVTNPHDSYSLQQWGDIAQKLQVNAAKKLSELSIGSGGGIQQVNGQYFVNGQEMSLSQVNFCVRANQYQLIDQQIADQMDAIQRNNAKAKEAQNLLSAIKKAFEAKDLGQVQTSSVTAGTFFDATQSDGIIQTFMKAQFGDVAVTDASYENYYYVINNWNANPTLKSNLKDFFDLIKTASPTFYKSHVTDTNGAAPYTFTGTVTNSDYSDLKTAISSYLSSNSTDNQVAQQRLEALNNTRQAVLSGMGAFTQGQSQMTDRIGGNL
jgi:hypothetical protein